MIAAVNAVGNHIPPMLLFPCVFFKDHMINKGAPLGSVGCANKSVWSNKQIFVDYIKYFVTHVKPSQEEKILIILYNHETHIHICTRDKPYQRKWNRIANNASTYFSSITATRPYSVWSI